MSLRDQLLKAGVVTEDQVKASEVAEEKAKQARKAKFQQRKTQGGKNAATNKKSADGTRKNNRPANAKSTNKPAQKSSAHQSNKSKAPTGPAKAGTPARKAQLLAIKHLIAQNRLNDDSATEIYNFVSAKKIRKVRVTENQTKQLASGELALIRNPQDSFDFVILPIDIAKEIAQTETNVMLVLNDGSMPEDDASEFETAAQSEVVAAQPEDSVQPSSDQESSTDNATEKEKPEQQS